jgi:hypothetical protein
LTLAEDVAALLRRARQRLGGSLKSVVNEALRRGLADILDEKPRSRSFRTRAVSLKPRLDDVDDVAQVLAVGEDEAFR